MASLSTGQATGWIDNNLPWVVNSTGDLPAADPAASPWTGNNNALGYDHPECTLKSIIEYLNDNHGGTADFNIPTADSHFSGGVYTITTAGLPPIEAPITVDGSSQPGYSGAPSINVVGETGGFTIAAGPSTLEYLAVTGSGGTGVEINDANGRDTVTGCYIGIEPGGQTAGNNLGYGVEIIGSQYNNVQSDVISGNDKGGIYITNSSYDSVTGCKIGMDSYGYVAVANEGDGVLVDGALRYNVIGGSTAVASNVDLRERRLWGSNIGRWRR